MPPSSLDKESWKFIVIQIPELREKLLDVAPGAVVKLKTASHFVVIASRKAGLLEDSAYSVSVLAAFGYRKADPERPKTRRAIEDIVEWV